MPIKRSGFYNDPAMAQAAANLSSLFEPPSGADEAGYANARQTEFETGQRKAIWDYIQSPDYDPALADRAGVFADYYDPSNSYQAVQTQADTQRYGYDKSFEGTQYTANTAAAASRANNTADNLAKLYVEGYDDLAPGEKQPAIPAEILSQFGGTVAVPEAQGNVKPLSYDEQKADYLRRLATGETTGLTDLDIIKQAMLGTEQQATVDPVTKQPVLTNRFDASGLKPVLAESEEKGLVFSQLPDRAKQESVVDIKGVDTYHAVNPDGKERTFVGYIGSDGRIYDQSNPGKPAEGVVSKGSGGNQFAVDFNPDGTVAGIRQGAGVGPRPTDAQNRAAMAAESSAPAVARLMAAYDDPAKMPSAADLTMWPTLTKMQRSDSLGTSALGQILNDSMMTDQGKTFFLDMMTLLPFQMIQRTGLAGTEMEWANLLYTAVPQPKDTPEMRQYRKEQLMLFLRVTKQLAGNALPENAAATEATTAPAATVTAAPAPASAPAAPAASGGSAEYVRDPVTKKLVPKAK